MKPAEKKVRQIAYLKYREVIRQPMTRYPVYESMPQLFNIVGDVFDNVLDKEKDSDWDTIYLMKLLNIILNPLY